MGALSVQAAPLPQQAARRPRRLHWPGYSLAGTAVALVFGCASFTPSLLPRDWVLQGLVDGLSAAFGYAVGVFLAWLAVAVTGRRPRADLTRWLWILVAVLGVPLVAWTMWLGQGWQRQVHLLTGEPLPDSYARVRILVLTVAVFVAVVEVGRGFRWLVRRVTGPLSRLMPDRLARPLAIVLVVLLLAVVNNGLLWRGLVSAANSVSGAANGTTSPGTVQPWAPERSGSPASLVSWDSLGRQGRDFVGRGARVSDLTRFSGVRAQRPIRVYVGLKSAPTSAQRTDLAVRELRRTGAFDRAVLLVVTTTGTGFVDPAAVEPIEYMYNGNTATVALQYSYLPSWISFLVDQKKAVEAGRDLFNHVYDAWSALPAGHRPKLLVTGSSLGAFGGEAAFSGVADLRHRTDGAVWAGTPFASGLHRTLVEQRDPGSPEWLPIYDSGRAVRFASTPADLLRPATTTWQRPRVVYLQNGSDPIVFWTPRLAFDKPDWLSEPRAPDVSPSMFWIPVVTFWQVSADLPFALEAPAGHGHSYQEMFVNAWAAVAPPSDWTARDTHRLRALIAALPEPPGSGLWPLS